MTKDIKLKLENYLLRILHNEIIIADESYFILQTITGYWDRISIEGYNLFFKSLYSTYFVRFSLALTKLFDKPSANNETISIPFVINFIEDNFFNFLVQERDNLNRQFALLGYELEFISSLSDKELNKRMIEYFKLRLPSNNYSEDLDLSKTLKIIKKYRDKHYTHNEYIQPEYLPKTTFKKALDLLDFAKQFVSIFSLAYLNIFHSVNGTDYFFTKNAMMTNTSFKRLLEKAKLMKIKKM